MVLPRLLSPIHSHWMLCIVPSSVGIVPVNALKFIRTLVAEFNNANSLGICPPTALVLILKSCNEASIPISVGNVPDKFLLLRLIFVTNPLLSQVTALQSDATGQLIPADVH